MRDLLDKKQGKKKKREKKKREKLLIAWLDKKDTKIARCVAVFFGEAEWKLTKLVQLVSAARRAVNEEAQFSENVSSNYSWNMI